MSENNQALFVLSTHHHPHPGSGRAEPEWAEEQPGGSGNIGGGDGAACGRGAGVLCDSWAHNVTIVPSQSCICSLRVVDREEQSWKHLPGPWEKAYVTRLGEREILNAHVVAHPQANLTKVRRRPQKNTNANSSATALSPP